MVQRSIIKLIIILMMMWIVPITSAHAEESVQVRIKSEHGESPRPDLDTVHVELTFAAIHNGTAHLLLMSPQRKFFSPTDFPFVEGTQLIDADLQIENGKLSFDYMFPIRGDYLMVVETKDDNGQALGTHDLTITIKENPAEIRNAIVFIAILALFGLLIGYLFAKLRGRSSLYES